MQRRNWVLLGIAVVLGLFAVLLANAWFSGVEQQQGRSGDGQKLVRVVVASQQLDFGTRLTGQNVRLQDWPEGSVPQGAFRSLPEALRYDRVAIRPLVPGEPVLASKVSGTDGRATLAALLPPGMRAVSVAISPVRGVSGFVLPGSMVDVILTRRIGGEGMGREDHRSDVILENIQVLAIDQLANDRQSEPKIAKTATLAVTLFDAQRLAVAEQTGTLSLALRNVTDAGGVPASAAAQAPASRTVTALQLGGARIYVPVRSASTAPAGTPAQAYSGGALVAPALPGLGAGVPLAQVASGPVMTVIRGTQPTTYPVGKSRNW